ncbi:MAG: hypothetical protein JWO81_793 [Alphaproteobacteria bacterium]|nr:hypothetical protein [Alphaproteobacteria bacterium]
MTDDDDDTRDQDESKQFGKLLSQHFLANDYSYGPLVRAVADEPKKTDSGDQCWRLNQGLDVVEEIMLSVNDDAWRIGSDEEAEAKRKFWYHQGSVRLAGKKRLEPYIPVQGVQDSAASYLRLPYRVEALDRILVDMLIASEMLAFADEVQPIVKKKLPILLRWLLNNVLSLLIGCAIAGSLFWIGNGNVAMNWLAGIILAFTILGTAWSLISFPFFYPKLSAHHRKVEDIIAAMLDAYSALGGSPASAKHVDERIARATDKGAIWPSQLIVLMEDIRARRQTI